MELAGFGQEFDPYARALSSTNQNGKITFEGDIKGRRQKQWAVFALLGLGFGKNKSFSPFFELDLVDPDFRFLLF